MVSTLVSVIATDVSVVGTVVAVATVEVGEGAVFAGLSGRRRLWESCAVGIPV